MVSRGGRWALSGVLAAGTVLALLTGSVAAPPASADDLPAPPRTAAQLDATKDRIDALAAETRAPTAVTSWWVDLATRTVVLAVTSGPRDARADAFVGRARELGPEVRVVDGSRPVAPHADLVGGDAIFTGGARCSIGFSARTLSGAPRMLTAGHCTQKGGDVRGADNQVIGPIRSSVFGRAGDWGVVDVGPTWSVTSQVAGVGDATTRLIGTASASVGSPVCRSGSTTGRHCGVVTAVDVTANYSSGPVTGLTATSACSEPGDSGGPFVGGSSAVGLLSGGSGDCKGSAGTTLFQPIEPVLRAEGLSLVVG